MGWLDWVFLERRLHRACGDAVAVERDRATLARFK
jgi:hypothetical protein